MPKTITDELFNYHINAADKNIALAKAAWKKRSSNVVAYLEDAIRSLEEIKDFIKGY